MTPVDILSEQLYKYKKALKKSKETFDAGKITPELHRIHRTNNEPAIEIFELAITILKENNIP